MNKILKWFAPLLLIFPLVAGAVPDLVLKDFSGNNRNISDYIGKDKWTVVVVWAHDCSVCNNEIHHNDLFS